MKPPLLLFIFVLTFSSCLAQFDPFKYRLVYQEPAMAKVKVRSKLVFKTISKDSSLNFNIYYPEKMPAGTLPVVIFNNGVGSLDLPDWPIYMDWARLMAARGIIGITHQSRNGKANQDFADLMTYISEHATELNIDRNRVGIWTCSGNTPVGWPFANNPANNPVKAVAVFYGMIPREERTVKRKDLEVLLVRAGLDAFNLNKGMEDLMLNALQDDAHVEFINYPEGQHAFDAFDNTTRSKEIILHTVDFFRRNLLMEKASDASLLITNRQLWQMVLTDSKTDEAISEYKRANQFYRTQANHSPFFNQLLNENNLTGLGYQLLGAGRTEDAIKIFKLETETFPDAANGFDALSDAYKKAGDQENTLVNARKALEKLNNPNLPPAFAKAIRESAEGKINEITNPTVESVPYVRAHHEVFYNEIEKKVMLTGGSTPLNGGQSFRMFNDVWYLNEGRWQFAGKAGDERSGMRLAYDSKRNQIFSFGGYTGQSRPEFRVWENNDWKIVTALPEMAAAEPGFVYDAKRDRLVVFGGSGSPTGVNANTWEWNGNVWKKMDTNGPAGRQAFAMVYDAKRNKTVVFGGMGGSTGQGSRNPMFGDTWEYDGTWRKVSEDGPGARTSPGFAFDSKRGLVIIFGGLTESGMKKDTWSWDGKSWKKLAEDGPPARAMGYMAYDKQRDRIVMFGGRRGWPNDVNDTWEWDGTKWMMVSDGKN